MAPSKKGIKKPSKVSRFRGVPFHKWRALKMVSSQCYAGAVSSTSTSSNSDALSASGRKIGVSQPSPVQNSLNTTPEGYRMVDLKQLSDALKCVKLCQGAFIQLHELPHPNGLLSELVLVCSACGEGHKFYSSPKTLPSGKAADINRRTTYAAIEVGLGREGLADMCSILNMPPPVTSTSYSQHVKAIYSGSEEQAETQMREAVQRAREAAGGAPTGDAVVDLTVTFDGTWAKRGFTSNFGVGVVMSVDTGEVLDREVISKYCEECSRKNSVGKESDEYKLWWEGHKQNCSINFSGSSPAMEANAAKIIWGRSITKYNVRYTHMVSDGDSKAFKDVQYTYGTGKGNEVEKLDCIGHVGKRMFRALEKIKTETKGKLSDGKSVGRGKGRLRGGKEVNVPLRLSELYRNAIRNNVDKIAGREGGDRLDQAVLKMQEAILAVLYHEVKIPDNTVRHQYCPSDSWCDYKKSGKMDDKDYHLDEVFLDLLLPTFQ